MREEYKQEIENSIKNSGHSKLSIDNKIRYPRVTKHTFYILDTQNVDNPHYPIDSVHEAVEFLSTLTDDYTKEEIEEDLRKQYFDENKQLYLIHQY